MKTESTKIPPNSVESEESVLGGLLIHNDSWDQVADLIIETDFYEPNNKIIFSAISTLINHNKPADILTVKEQLARTNELDIVGGFEHLASIAENTPSIDNIETYAKHVRELSIYRQLIAASQDIANKAFNPKNMEVQDLLDLSEKRIFDIAEQIQRSKRDITNVKDITKDIVNLAHKWEQDSGALTGLETGFSKLDEMTSGFQNGDLIIIAGRPSMGKTALAMNIVGNVSINQKIPVAVFSLEMATEQLVLRMVSSFGHIDSKKIRDGSMTETDWNSFNHAVRALEENTILVDETPGITPTEIRAKCRRLKRQFPDLGLIMIDYLQLMQVHGRKENRVQEVSEISRSLKALAKEINVPVIALSQLNRGVDSRPKTARGRMPNMSDLRESGSIEQDADIICFIYRDEAYHDDSYVNPDEVGKADLKIAKHRNGAIGKIKLSWIAQYTRFENLVNDDRFEHISEKEMDIAYANNMNNFEDPEPF